MSPDKSLNFETAYDNSGSMDQAKSQDVAASSDTTPSAPSVKKTRLSLKSKGEGRVSGAAQQKITSMLTSPAPAADKRDEGRPPEETITVVKVPCVAALHNLGNTCYLNSALQVLRYTPGFVDYVDLLTEEIRQSQDDASRSLDDNESDDEIEDDLACKMVVCLHELFRRMVNRETSYGKGETEFIALRPYDVVDTLQKLNAVFEGGTQQDAHEALLCLLRYVQEACNIVNRFRKKLLVRSTRLVSSRLVDDVIPQLDGVSDKDMGTVKTYAKRRRKSLFVDNNVMKESVNLGNKTNITESTDLKLSSQPLLKFFTPQTKTENKGLSISSPGESLSHAVTDSQNVKPEVLNMDSQVASQKHQLSGKSHSLDSPEQQQSSKEKVKKRKLSSPKNNENQKKRKSKENVEKRRQTKCAVKKPVKIDSGHEQEGRVSTPSDSQAQDVSKKPVKRFGMTSRTFNKTAEQNSQNNTSTSAESESGPLSQSCVVNGNKAPGQTQWRKQTARKSFRSDQRLVEQALSQRAVVSLERCSVPPDASNTKPVSHPIEDYTKTMFTGSMALRTRCLDCEHYTERKEDYQALTVPISRRGNKKAGDSDSEDEDDIDDGVTWLVHSLHQVERLTGENKFTCDQCLHLVEVERSCHVLTIPLILMMQQIRFSVFSCSDGNLSKISDFRPTPYEMPCILDGCHKPCEVPHHRYELYAVITHTGISLTSGHYVAYVRPDNHNGSAASNTTPKASSQADAHVNHNATDSEVMETDVMTGETEVLWYECDDKHITVLTQQEMQDVLSPSGIGTPYLLFYRPVSYKHLPFCRT